MAKYFFVLIFLFSSIQTFAQNLPRPSWTRNLLFPPHEAGYIFVWGEGESSTPSKAKNISFANAVKKGLYELRDIELTEQNVKDIEEKGFEAVATYTKRAIREVCQSEPIILDNEKYKVYVLIQVERDINHPADFYIMPSNFESCEDPVYSQEVAEWNSGLRKRKKAIEEEERKIADKARRKEATHSLFHDYSYFGGIICGISYPFDIVAGITGRHGGTLGIGYSVLLGAGRNEKFSFASPCGFRCYTDNVSAGEYITYYEGEDYDYERFKIDGIGGSCGLGLTYSACLKLYVYKHLYVGYKYGRFNYGNVEYYDSDLSLTSSGDVREADVKQFIKPLKEPNSALVVGFQRLNALIIDINVSVAKNPITDKMAFSAQFGWGFGSLFD